MLFRAHLRDSALSIIRAFADARAIAGVRSDPVQWGGIEKGSRDADKRAGERGTRGRGCGGYRPFRSGKRKPLRGWFPTFRVLSRDPRKASPSSATSRMIRALRALVPSQR